MAALSATPPPRFDTGGVDHASPRTGLSLPFRAALIFAAWTLIGVSGLLRGFVTHKDAMHPAAMFQCVWQWALYTPVIFRLAERFPIERGGWLRSFSIHVFFMLAFTLADVTVDYALSPWVDPSLHGDLLTRYAQEQFIDVLCYFAVVAVGHALRLNRLSQQRMLEASRLQGELLRARLTALEMRLRPHFLYNTLHSIAALVRVQRGPEAISMIAGLGDLLRDVLESNGAVEVPLRRELALAQRYLAIEQIRFGDRLRVVVNVAPEVMESLVPTLLLQPIVENAVRHGIEVDPNAGLIEIDARRVGSELELRVHDDGRGTAENGCPTHVGIGLGTTRERLREMFGEGCSVSLASGERGDITTTVRLPLRREAAGPPTVSP